MYLSVNNIAATSGSATEFIDASKVSSPSPAHDRLRNDLQFHNVKLLPLKESYLTWYAASMAHIYRGTHLPDCQHYTRHPLSFLEQRPLIMCLRINNVAATHCSIHKKSPGRLLTIGTPKNRGDLLSQLVGQYHRRG